MTPKLELIKKLARQNIDETLAKISFRNDLRTKIPEFKKSDQVLEPPTQNTPWS